jgi:phosphonate transport system permease protein
MSTVDLTASPGSGVHATPLPSRPAGSSRRRSGIVIALVVLGLVIYGWINVGGSLTDLINGFFGSKGVIRSIVGPSLPPASSAIGEGLTASVTTFCIAFLSIVFGLVWSVAMLPWAARNLAPNRLCYEVARGIQAILRAIPELIMMLIFLITVGITPFAAVVALSFHGIGVKGKLFAETVEEMDMGPVEALRVAGASRTQVFLHAVLPGARNTLLGLTLYRLDANFRSAVTLGAVGGGGIGFLINNQLNSFVFKAVATYLIIMVLWVLAIERVSEMLRARL